MRVGDEFFRLYENLLIDFIFVGKFFLVFVRLIFNVFSLIKYGDFKSLFCKVIKWFLNRFFLVDL